MYKLRIHPAMWVPVYERQQGTGILFLILLTILGSLGGGAYKPFEFIVSLKGNPTVAFAYLIIAVCIALNLTFLLLKSAQDYLSTALAAPPVIGTIFLLSLFTFGVSVLWFIGLHSNVTFSNVQAVLSDDYTVLLLIGGGQLSLVALLFLLSRYWPNTGSNLSAVGHEIRRMLDLVDVLCRENAGSTDYPQARESFFATLAQLSQQLQAADNELAIKPNNIPDIVENMSELIKWGKSAGNEALQEQLSILKRPQFISQLAACLRE